MCQLPIDNQRQLRVLTEVTLLVPNGVHWNWVGVPLNSTN
jgi:hypothetical protein